MMKIKDSFFFISLLLILGVTSCTNNIVFEQNKDFVTQTWHKDSAIVFKVEITDSTEVYNIFFNTRITGDYYYQNLFLFIDTDMPYNNSTRDTLECILSKQTGEPYGKPDGNWLGVGLGHIWAYKIGYKSFVRFPYSGTYEFSIKQAMRDVELDHVLDAGVTIEKAKR